MSGTVLIVLALILGYVAYRCYRANSKVQQILVEELGCSPGQGRTTRPVMTEDVLFGRSEVNSGQQLRTLGRPGIEFRAEA